MSGHPIQFHQVVIASKASKVCEIATKMSHLSLNASMQISLSNYLAYRSIHHSWKWWKSTVKPNPWSLKLYLFINRHVFGCRKALGKNKDNFEPRGPLNSLCSRNIVLNQICWFCFSFLSEIRCSSGRVPIEPEPDRVFIRTGRREAVGLLGLHLPQSSGAQELRRVRHAQDHFRYDSWKATIGQAMFLSFQKFDSNVVDVVFGRRIVRCVEKSSSSKKRKKFWRFVACPRVVA
jgi:hypothetical protein